MDDPEQLGSVQGTGPPEPVRIEVAGLSVYTHHGVGEAEREVGQRLVFDLALELDECAAAATDRLEDTVDYGEVTRAVASAAQSRSYRTLERLCGAIADHLLDEHPAVAAVTVRAAKPEPPIEVTVEEVAVELRKERRER